MISYPEQDTNHNLWRMCQLDRQSDFYKEHLKYFQCDEEVQKSKLLDHLREKCIGQSFCDETDIMAFFDSNSQCESTDILKNTHIFI